MVSNQKFQNCIDEIAELTGCAIALFSETGKMIAKTALLPEAVQKEAVSFMNSAADQERMEDYLLFKVMVEDIPEYVLVISNNREDAGVLGMMSVMQVRNLALSSREQMDRNKYMQNLLLGNMLLVDQMSKAKKLHIDDRMRVAFVIDTGKKSSDVVMELVKNLSNMKSGDFVTSIETGNVVLIRDVNSIPEEELAEELQSVANLLVDTLHMEAMVKVRVGYGNPVAKTKDIPQSYQEAKLALEVGRVFNAQQDTISYSRLGIGRLIYQIPNSLCEMFIREVFGDKVPEILEDEEAMSTINKFFENNLNISETARQLYVHRNTLVYRLERIQKAIGLDIRVFEDAMTFRIAVMVLAHLKQQS